jgi:shikimate dehydrogenase
MNRYAEVIGDPISHTKSPLIHNFWLDKLALAGSYRAQPVRPAELAGYLADRRSDPDWCGCNITLPLKVIAMQHIEAASPLAKLIGATNAVIRNSSGVLEAGNTDASGFAAPLRGRAFSRVIVIGAGGAARAVLAGLRTSEVRQVTILNRDVMKARALIREFGLDGQALALDDDPPAADLLVNASSLGMTGQADLPDMMNNIRDGGTVYDLVYAPLETALLAAARGRGLDVIDGLTMLVEQAAEAFEIFFGVAAPREHDTELRRLLTA